MSEHTPGPWISEGKAYGKTPDAGCGIIASNDRLKISNPSRGIVAWVTRHVGKRNAEVEANASLIAAAPDLLAALKRMVDRWEPDCSGQDRIMWEEASAAIAKAMNGTKTETQV